MHVIERLITVHNEDSDKLTVFGEFLLIALSYRVSKIKYTRLISHNTAAIASMVKIRRGVDS